ncbi:hypothetical protein TB927.1.5150 [Trypanosoma brucei brucei TREU927]|uniref:Uncharacterized protein n=1 Tax=Trypanosoma brucei brucei (strain 927/4 GUTat10.1) TaxID=185431 RepID=Q4GY66_TRYB2|nr:hypothetical protein TB927.1.5150 [Trypanosoma brucei brucei TREU927]CAJ16721.1 hypothetical protein TB927.1.5150 [Trypanosoma brucei brucei TREU927]
MMTKHLVAKLTNRFARERSWVLAKSQSTFAG